MNTTIQIPVKKQLRDKAVKVAEKQGFSSLQEVVRVFLNKYANQEMKISFESPPQRLSDKNDMRYSKMIKEIKSGKAKTKSFTDVGSLMDSQK